MSESTVAQALVAARARGLERLDAQLLLSRVLDRPRSWLLGHGEAPLAAELMHRFEALCGRRAGGEPIAYLLGEKEFHGLVLQVDAAVLVPRPDTETLVDWALERLAAGPPRPQVADLGTGSGAIALALARARPDASVCGLDLSTAALAVARANADRLALAVEWLHSDWWTAVGTRRFDLIVSNPPYIAEGDPHLAALRHEPRMALTSGSDGLGALRTIISGAAAHLRPGGWLLVEHGHTQGEAVRNLLERAALKSVTTRADLEGRPRCSGAQRTAL